MDASTIALAATAVFLIALVFSMLGLGGAMLYVPTFKWLDLPLKTTAIPLGLLLNGVTSISGFAAHAAAGRFDALLTATTLAAAIAGSQLGAWFMARRAKPAWVKTFYGVLLLGVAAKLIWDIV